MDNDGQGSPGLEGMIEQMGAEITETSIHPTDTRKTYFFAYDSLLNQSNLSRYVKKLLPFKVVRLPNHRLAWPFFYPPKNSALPSLKRTNESGDEVWGMIFQATGLKFDDLDRHLRVPDRYHKKQFQVVDRGGRRYHTFAYILTPTSETDLTPSKEYIAQLVFLAQERGLPDAWIDKLRSVDTA